MQARALGEIVSGGTLHSLFVQSLAVIGCLNLRDVHKVMLRGGA